MHVEHKITYPDEAEVRLTIVCSVAEAKSLREVLARDARPASCDVYHLLSDAIKQASATIYARPEEPKSTT